MSSSQGNPFDSAWLKWARAVQHAQALDADIERVTNSADHAPLSITLGEYDTRRHGFPVRIGMANRIPTSWNLALGDLAHNLRCSLDHLAWALVQRGHQAGRLSAGQLRAVYFPIATSSSHFRSLAPNKLPGLRRTDLAIVRRYQPYTKGKTRVQWHSFTVLNETVKSDKHRNIQSVWWLPDGPHFKIAESADCRFRYWKIWPPQLAKVDTELAFVYVRKTGPNPDLQVEYAFASYHPAFHERLWLDHWAEITVVTVMKLLAEFAEPPGEFFAALGIDIAWLDKAIDTWKGAASIWAAQTSGGTPPFKVVS